MPCVACGMLCVHSQAIYKAARTRRIMQDSEKRKLKNRIEHSAPGSVKVKPERKKKVVAEME